MTAKVKRFEFGEVTRRKSDGKLGARVWVRLQDGDLHSTQEFDTHGMNEEEVVDAIEDLRQWHERWAARQRSFGSVVGTEITIDSETYRIVDCTVPSDRPYDDVYLVLGIRRVVGSTLSKLPGWPYSLHYSSIGDVPSNQEIVALVSARLQEQLGVQSAHAQFKQKVEKAVKKRAGGGEP
jgi:hypothetical protein